MARLVAAFGSSHSIMLTAEQSDWLSAFRDSDRRMPLFDRRGAARSYDELLAGAPADALARVTEERLLAAHARTFAAIAELKRQIAATELDVLIIAGDDQHELFEDSFMPALGIYYGDSIRNASRTEVEGEGWYKAAQRRRLEPEHEAHYPVHAPLAHHFVEGLTESGFDICAIRAIAPAQFEGHAYSYIHRTYLLGRALPIVPIFLNTYYPPNPITPRRCVELGRALKRLVASFPQDLRVGIIASGGLSHFVVDEELDKGVLEALKGKDLQHLASLDPKRLQAGSSEIRSWIVTGAAAVDLELTWADYIPAYRTPALTGIGLGFARWSQRGTA